MRGRRTRPSSPIARLRCEGVDHDATWHAHDAPYIAQSGFSAASAAGSANIVIEAGSVLKLGPAASIAIRDNAGLALAGTASAPVTVTSSKRTPSAGDWTEIDIYASSSDAHSRFEYAILEYGGNAENFGMVWLDSGAGMSATNTQFNHSTAYGLYLSGGAKLGSFTDNTVTDNAKGALYIGANGVEKLGVGTYSPDAVTASSWPRSLSITTHVARSRCALHRTLGLQRRQH